MNGPGRPRIAERAEAQRARILDAAQKCFIEQGFHAATMGAIAETAGMSAGLIYRYFESKNAVVLAIIERELVRGRERIASLHGCADLTAGLIDVFLEFQSPKAADMMNAALFLEMSAEATRVPQIAEALRAADAQSREDLAAWLARLPADGGLGMRKDEAQRRALSLQFIVGGLAVRAARTPGYARRELRKVFEPWVSALVTVPEKKPSGS